MEILLLFLVAVIIWAINRSTFSARRKHRTYGTRYLKLDTWLRKRHVVLRRDKWRCVYCGARATQVHHKRNTGRNIGKEPVKWLVSACKTCHESQHR